MTGRADCRGSISVFFALLLTTILAVICTSLESARHAALSYLTAQAGESALESVFAGYYKPLWKRYHLLFMADGAGFVPAAEETLSCYEDPGNGAGGTDLYGFRTEAVTPLELVTAPDRDGEAFLQAILEDMKAHGATELAGTLLGQAELVEEAKTVSDYIGSLSEYEKEVSAMEEHYLTMEEQGYRLRKTWEGLDEALRAGNLTEETGRELLNEAKTCAAETLRKTEESYGEILAGTERLGNSLEKEEARLLEQKEHVSRLSYGQMEAEFKNLTEYTREDGSRRLAAESTKEILEACAGELGRTAAWDDGAASEELKEIIEKGSETLKTFEKKHDGAGKKSELLETVKSWKENGILGLVLEDAESVSDRELPEGAGLSRAVKETEGEGRKAGALEKGAEVLYAAGHFGRFGEEKEDTALAYEVEYILHGSKSDRENLKKTAEGLLAVRSGMNFLYLLTDTGKQAEAEAMAAVLVGFTGIYPLVKLMKGILLGAWAFAEAVSDVRILYKGGQVPLIKTGRDWKLSLKGAADAASCEIEAGEEKGMWDYKGYLCILLLMGNVEEQCFRMMDLIEENLRKEDAGFFMENCISYALVEFKLQAEPVFFRLPFSGDTGYRFCKTAAYGYYDLPQAEE